MFRKIGTCIFVYAFLAGWVWAVPSPSPNAGLLPASNGQPHEGTDSSDVELQVTPNNGDPWSIESLTNYCKKVSDYEVSCTKPINALMPYNGFRVYIHNSQPSTTQKVFTDKCYTHDSFQEDNKHNWFDFHPTGGCIKFTNGKQGKPFTLSAKPATLVLGIPNYPQFRITFNLEFQSSLNDFAFTAMPHAGSILPRAFQKSFQIPLILYSNIQNYEESRVGVPLKATVNGKDNALEPYSDIGYNHKHYYHSYLASGLKNEIEVHELGITQEIDYKLYSSAGKPNRDSFNAFDFEKPIKLPDPKSDSSAWLACSGFQYCSKEQIEKVIGYAKNKLSSEPVKKVLIDYFKSINTANLGPGVHLVASMPMNLYEASGKKLEILQISFYYDEKKDRFEADTLFATGWYPVLDQQSTDSPWRWQWDGSKNEYTVPCWTVADATKRTSCLAGLTQTERKTVKSKP